MSTCSVTFPAEPPDAPCRHCGGLTWWWTLYAHSGLCHGCAFGDDEGDQ